MAVTQISVFAESRPGRLCHVLELFSNANVSVKGYSVSDTGEFGITRYIVDNIAAAKTALDSANCAYTTSDVICCKLNDVPGELANVARTFAKSGQNILYSYSMISTYIVISVENIKNGEDVLTSAGFTVVNQNEISQL